MHEEICIEHHMRRDAGHSTVFGMESHETLPVADVAIDLEITARLLRLRDPRAPPEKSRLAVIFSEHPWHEQAILSIGTTRERRT